MSHRPASPKIKIVPLTGDTFDVSFLGQTKGNFKSKDEAYRFAEKLAASMAPEPKIVGPRDD